ncbi:MAG: family 2A encapsulin nanocompartment cargo protein cysteine desulfurase, partial [Acidobacteriaceae bacterium]
MSTSDQDRSGDFAEHAPGAIPPGGMPGMAGLPDIALLSRLANEFFRAQPEQGFATSIVPDKPDGRDVTPLFTTRLPEAGMPMPAVPAIPSAGGVPVAPGISGLSMGVTETAPFVIGPAAALSLPLSGPVAESSTVQPDPRSAATPVSVSPFAMPMPEFGASFPSFEAGMPSLPAFAPLRTEDEARAVLTATSPFYFLQHAGGLEGSGHDLPMAAPSAGAIAAPQAKGSSQPYDLPGIAGAPASSFSRQIPSAVPGSMPTAGLDPSLFQGFAGVPQLAPLPPLRNQEEAEAALQQALSFYFVDQAGSLERPLEKGNAESMAAGRLAGAQPAGGPDLKLPRQQFDIGSVRRDFPILHEEVNGHPLVWLDNAATTQKPQSVIDRLKYFYEHENSNIHRAAHELAARATDAYEDARSKVAHFLNASSTKEIVFVRGATEAINLVAQAWGRRHIQKGDEIVISWIEHHANIVPWQMLCAENGACLRVAPVDNDGQILLDEYEKLLTEKTRLVSFTQVSNALGTVTPAHQMVQMAHRYGARVLLDGAQAVSHMPIDVQSLDCDFYVFSGHKVFAPTGIGVLYGKPEVLAETPPWQGGGNMIVDVTFEKTTYQPPPGRFEAGTGNIADAVGLGAAIDYLDHIGMPNVARYEHELLVYATQAMLRVPGLRIIGTAKEKAGVLSFVLEGFQTQEVGAALNREGIAVRSGHHCAQPTLRRFGLETTVRPSLA